MIYAAEGIAALLTGTGLARGFWSHWKQTWLGILSIKCIGVSWSHETSRSYMECLPKLKVGMISSISSGEKR